MLEAKFAPVVIILQAAKGPERVTTIIQNGQRSNSKPALKIVDMEAGLFSRVVTLDHAIAMRASVPM